MHRSITILLNMTKKDVKVRELAKELGVTARALIDRCRSEGLRVQNSITRIGPADVRRIRVWYHAPPDKPLDPPTPIGEAGEIPPQNEKSE